MTSFGGARIGARDMVNWVWPRLTDEERAALATRTESTGMIDAIMAEAPGQGELPWDVFYDVLHGLRDLAHEEVRMKTAIGYVADTLATACQNCGINPTCIDVSCSPSDQVVENATAFAAIGDFTIDSALAVLGQDILGLTLEEPFIGDDYGRPGRHGIVQLNVVAMKKIPGLGYGVRIKIVVTAYRKDTEEK